MTPFDATIEFMKLLLQRPDAPLFTPREIAEKAQQYTTEAVKIQPPTVSQGVVGMGGIGGSGVVTITAGGGGGKACQP